ncbi:MAG: VWA domain-containing protein [Bacteroidia bacterium]|nr:VWA domain-containing protein [Bacteroidia bacterium]MDW8235347.1 VWA domain-containing protein [Bacteroidia bacterium]
MSFLFPAFLWGLLAIAVPIIVHFFYLRRAKPYEFSRTLLVEKLKQASRPYLRLRHWILLLIRIGIVIAIVFAFAKPQWGQNALKTERGASVLIVWDVSPSMHPYMEAARALLQKVLEQDPPAYEYRLLTTDSHIPKGGFVSARALSEKISQVQPASMGYPIASVLSQPDFLFEGASYKARRVYIVSDQQASSMGDLAKLSPEKLGTITLLSYPLITRRPNAWVDTLSVRPVPEGILLSYALKMHDLASCRVKVGTQKYLLSAGLHQTSFKLSVPFTELQIEGDAVSIDNRLFIGSALSYSYDRPQIVWERLPSCIGADWQRLHEIMGLTPQLSDKIHVSPDLRIMIREIKDIFSEPELRWITGGGTLVAFPPSGLTVQQWQSCFLSNEVTLEQVWRGYESVRLRPGEHAFWEGVFLPSAREGALLPEPLHLTQWYAFRAKAALPLLWDEKGRILLQEIPFGKGKIYLFSVPCQVLFASRHSLLVPLLDKLYRSGTTDFSRWTVHLGSQHTLSLRSTSNEPPLLRHLYEKFEYIPPHAIQGEQTILYLGQEPIPAGIYEVYIGKDKQGYLGVNIPHAESSPETYEIEYWNRYGFSVEVVSQERGAISRREGFPWRSYWMWLGIALALILLEVFWARRLLRPTTLSPLQTASAPPSLTMGSK